MRSWTSGREHITTESITDLILQELAALADVVSGDVSADEYSDRKALLEKARSRIEGAIGLTGQVAYEQGIRHGRRSQPSPEDLLNAHQEGYRQGWCDAMSLRDSTENWNDDQSYPST